MAPSVLLACPECDHLHRVREAPPTTPEFCVRCGSILRKGGDATQEVALALYVTALALFLLANASPILTLRLKGVVQAASLGSCAQILAEQGWPWLAAILITTVILAPLVYLGGMCWVLFQVRQGWQTARTAWLFRAVGQFRAWQMAEVFVLGIIVSYVKLTKTAQVVPGPSLLALVAFVVVAAAAVSRLNTEALWAALGPAPTPALRRPDATTAREAGLVACHTCQRLSILGTPQCKRCDSSLHSRKPRSRDRAWAFLITATLLYIPANILPVMRIVSMGRAQSDTIFSGIVYFLKTGSYGLAAIIFTASILVPIVKIAVLGFLLVSEGARLQWRPEQRAFLYRLTEAIGRWSMVDIFVITLMVAMVEMGNVASVSPGSGAVAFAMMVVTTMIAVNVFDPRLVWDALDATPSPTPQEQPNG